MKIIKNIKIIIMKIIKKVKDFKEKDLKHFFKEKLIYLFIILTLQER